uniref:Uncharacterized protein n=1 Tax=Oxyrrhis marina TaxID=2969 RepID=A0A7S4LN25_OXYMA
MRVSLLAVFAVASLAGQHEMKLAAERYEAEEADRDVDEDADDADREDGPDGPEDADPQDDGDDETGAADAGQDGEDGPAQEASGEEDAEADDTPAAADDSPDTEDADPAEDEDIEDGGDGDAAASEEQEDLTAGDDVDTVGSAGPPAVKVSNVTQSVADVVGGEDDSSLGLSADDKVIEKEAQEKAEQDAEKVLKKDNSAPGQSTEFPIKLDPSLKDAEVRHETEEFDLSLQQRLRR